MESQYPSLRSTACFALESARATSFSQSFWYLKNGPIGRYVTGGDTKIPRPVIHQGMKSDICTYLFLAFRAWIRLTPGVSMRAVTIAQEATGRRYGRASFWDGRWLLSGPEVRWWWRSWRRCKQTKKSIFEGRDYRATFTVVVITILKYGYLNGCAVDPSYRSEHSLLQLHVL